MEDRLILSIDGLDEESVSRLKTTAPEWIRVDSFRLTPLSASPGDGWPCVMIYLAGGIAGAEAIKIITKWLMEGLRELAKKKVQPGLKSPPTITISNRQIDYEEGAIRRIVEEKIEIRHGQD